MATQKHQQPHDQSFDKWINVKKDLHNYARLPHISEGEVWWCGVGQNVGIEINGKSTYFSRPVLIYKKFSVFGFLAIPLSTQTHQGPWYTPFEFQGKKQVAVLSQIRVISTSRLYRRMGMLSKKDFRKIKQDFLTLFD